MTPYLTYCNVIIIISRRVLRVLTKCFFSKQDWLFLIKWIFYTCSTSTEWIKTSVFVFVGFYYLCCGFQKEFVTMLDMCQKTFPSGHQNNDILCLIFFIGLIYLLWWKMLLTNYVAANSVNLVLTILLLICKILFIQPISHRHLLALLFKSLFPKEIVKNIHRFLSMWQCRSSYILIKL